jgi:hypothetical protein
MKTMDINEAHYNMGHMGAVGLQRYLNHRNIKGTGKFQDCTMYEVEGTKQGS